MVVSISVACLGGTCGQRQQMTEVGHRRWRSLRMNRSITCNTSDNDRDWDTEMSIFKKRTLKPNQLEALRKLEEDSVSSGKVRLLFSLVLVYVVH